MNKHFLFQHKGEGGWIGRIGNGNWNRHGGREGDITVCRIRPQVFRHTMDNQILDFCVRNGIVFQNNGGKEDVFKTPQQPQHNNVFQKNPFPFDLSEM